MYVGKDFDPADPGESEVYSFDFGKGLADGETIVSAVWSCAVAADSTGADGSAATRLSGAPTNVGKITSQTVANLQGGVKYLLRAVATTSAGQIVSLWSHVTCNTPT